MSRNRNISEIEDALLIKEYLQNKDKALVGELFKRYTGFVFLVSMKYLKNEEQSKDAVMQIFEKLFYDLLKHDIDNFKAWLHTVTRNHCLGYLRKLQTKQKHQENLKENAVFMENEAEEHLYKEEEYERQSKYLIKALAELKPEQKQCVELFYLKEKSYKEIVEITGFSDKKVKSYIQNGKRNLKLILQKFGTDGLKVLILLEISEVILKY